MYRLNIKYALICLCGVLASCQTAQIPKVIETQPVSVKLDIQKKSKVGNGLRVINIAIEQVKNNKLDIAEKILKSYLEKNNDERAQLNLALIYVKTNKNQQAKQLLKSVLATDSNNSVALEHLAIIARREGQFKKSKSLYLKALENSNRPSIHLNLAILLDLYLNELETALEHYKDYQSSENAEQDGIELDKWIADLNLRITRSK